MPLTTALLDPRLAMGLCYPRAVAHASCSHLALLAGNSNEKKPQLMRLRDYGIAGVVQDKEVQIARNVYVCSVLSDELSVVM